MEEEINNISPAPPQHLIENWAGELRICFRWRKIKFEGKSGPGVWVEKRGRPLSLSLEGEFFIYEHQLDEKLLK